MTSHPRYGGVRLRRRGVGAGRELGTLGKVRIWDERGSMPLSKRENTFIRQGRDKPLVAKVFSEGCIDPKLPGLPISNPTYEHSALSISPGYS